MAPSLKTTINKINRTLENNVRIANKVIEENVRNVTKAAKKVPWLHVVIGVVAVGIILYCIWKLLKPKGRKEKFSEEGISGKNLSADVAGKHYDYVSTTADPIKDPLKKKEASDAGFTKSSCHKWCADDPNCAVAVWHQPLGPNDDRACYKYNNESVPNGTSCVNSTEHTIFVRDANKLSCPVTPGGQASSGLVCGSGDTKYSFDNLGIRNNNGDVGYWDSDKDPGQLNNKAADCCRLAKTKPEANGWVYVEETSWLGLGTTTQKCYAKKYTKENLASDIIDQISGMTGIFSDIEGVDVQGLYDILKTNDVLQTKDVKHKEWQAKLKQSQFSSTVNVDQDGAITKTEDFNGTKVRIQNAATNSWMVDKDWKITMKSNYTDWGDASIFHVKAGQDSSFGSWVGVNSDPTWRFWRAQGETLNVEDTWGGKGNADNDNYIKFEKSDTWKSGTDPLYRMTNYTGSCFEDDGNGGVKLVGCNTKVPSQFWKITKA